MTLLTPVLAILSYLGLYCGLALGFIAPEEVKPLQKHLRAATWIMSILLFLSLLYTINSIIPLIAVICLFGWIFFLKKQPVDIRLIIISIPFFVIVSQSNVIVSTFLFLAGFPLGTLYLTKYVKKDELTKSKMKLSKKLFLETKLFWLSLVLFTAISLLFQF